MKKVLYLRQIKKRELRGEENKGFGENGLGDGKSID